MITLLNLSFSNYHDPSDSLFLLSISAIKDRVLAQVMAQVLAQVLARVLAQVMAQVLAQFLAQVLAHVDEIAAFQDSMLFVQFLLQMMATSLLFLASGLGRESATDIDTTDNLLSTLYCRSQSTVTL